MLALPPQPSLGTGSSRSCSRCRDVLCIALHCCPWAGSLSLSQPRASEHAAGTRASSAPAAPPGVAEGFEHQSGTGEEKEQSLNIQLRHSALAGPCGAQAPCSRFLGIPVILLMTALSHLEIPVQRNLCSLVQRKQVSEDLKVSVGRCKHQPHSYVQIHIQAEFLQVFALL